MATFSRIKTWVSNEVLTAAALNAEFDNIINNMTPTGMEDISSNVSAMQAVADPGSVGSESLATTLTGELQRLRFALKRIVGPQWYSEPAIDLSDLIDTADIENNAITTAKIADANVTKAKLSTPNVVSATKSTYQAITSATNVDVTDLALTITTTNNRPVELRIQGEYANSSFPSYAAIGVSATCNATDTNVSGAASAGTAHVHNTDVPVLASVGAYIEIYRETTISMVTDYTLIHAFHLDAAGDRMNSESLSNYLFSYSWLDTDFSETTGNDMKYKIKARVSGANVTGATVSFGAGLELIAREV